MTFRHEIGEEGLSTPAQIRSVWDHYAEIHAEPFRSALLSLPADAELWCERLTQWPTVKWENSRGSVTLAGDSAHPMTYRKTGSPHILALRALIPWERPNWTDLTAQIAVKASIMLFMMPALSVGPLMSMFLAGSRCRMSLRRMRKKLLKGAERL